jgi:hypothetical protein
MCGTTPDRSRARGEVGAHPAHPDQGAGHRRDRWGCGERELFPHSTSGSRLTAEIKPKIPGRASHSQGGGFKKLVRGLGVCGVAGWARKKGTDLHLRSWHGKILQELMGRGKHGPDPAITLASVTRKPRGLVRVASW